MDKKTPLYTLSHTVVNGVRRGRKIGFPTANLPYSMELKKDLGLGVYAVTVKIDGKTYNAVSNVGSPLTFSEEKPRIDIHILEFEGQLYGKMITVHFWNRLRDVQKFRNEQELISQIEDDIDKAMILLHDVN